MQKTLSIWRLVAWALVTLLVSFWLSHPFFSVHLSVCLLLPLSVIVLVFQPIRPVLYIFMPVMLLFDAVVAPYLGSTTVLLLLLYAVIKTYYPFFVASRVMHSWVLIAVVTLCYALLYLLYGAVHSQPLIQNGANVFFSWAVMLLFTPLLHHMFFRYILVTAEVSAQRGG